MSVSKQYARIAAQWPKDLLRPNRSFGAALLARRTALTGEKDASTSSQDPVQPIALDETTEARRIAALDSLLENRYKNMLALTDRTLRPQSRPTYYVDLIKDLDEAPTRNWLDRLRIDMKMFFRWKR